MTPRKSVKPKPLTDRVQAKELKIPGRSRIEAGDQLTIDGIRGRCTFVQYVKLASGAEWADVITSRGFSRSVSIDKIKTVHRKNTR